MIADKPDAYGTLATTVTNTSKQMLTAIKIAQVCNDGTSSSIGTDFKTLFIFGNVPITRGIAPEKSFPFDLADLKCQRFISAVFADGHGEGSDDPNYGWPKILTDRRASYAELLNIKGIIENMDPDPTSFETNLLQRLSDRSMQLAKYAAPEIPRSELDGRSFALDPILTGLRRPAEHRPVELTSRQGAIDLLEKWMAPLTSSK